MNRLPNFLEYLEGPHFLTLYDDCGGCYVEDCRSLSSVPGYCETGNLEVACSQSCCFPLFDSRLTYGECLR